MYNILHKKRLICKTKLLINKEFACILEGNKVWQAKKEGRRFSSYYMLGGKPQKT